MSKESLYLSLYPRAYFKELQPLNRVFYKTGLGKNGFAIENGANIIPKRLGVPEIKNKLNKILCIGEDDFPYRWAQDSKKSPKPILCERQTAPC